MKIHQIVISILITSMIYPVGEVAEKTNDPYLAEQEQKYKGKGRILFQSEEDRINKFKEKFKKSDENVKTALRSSPNELEGKSNDNLDKIHKAITEKLPIEENFYRISGKRSQHFIDELNKAKERIDAERNRRTQQKQQTKDITLTTNTNATSKHQPDTTHASSDAQTTALLDSYDIDQKITYKITAEGKQEFVTPKQYQQYLGPKQTKEKYVPSMAKDTDAQKTSAHLKSLVDEIQKPNISNDRIIQLTEQIKQSRTTLTHHFKELKKSASQKIDTLNKAITDLTNKITTAKRVNPSSDLSEIITKHKNLQIKLEKTKALEDFFDHTLADIERNPFYPNPMPDTVELFKDLQRLVKIRGNLNLKIHNANVGVEALPEGETIKNLQKQKKTISKKIKELKKLRSSNGLPKPSPEKKQDQEPAQPPVQKTVEELALENLQDSRMKIGNQIAELHQQIANENMSREKQTTVQAKEAISKKIKEKENDIQTETKKYQAIDKEIKDLQSPQKQEKIDPRLTKLHKEMKQLSRDKEKINSKIQETQKKIEAEKFELRSTAKSDEYIAKDPDIIKLQEQLNSLNANLKTKNAEIAAKNQVILNISPTNDDGGDW